MLKPVIHMKGVCLFTFLLFLAHINCYGQETAIYSEAKKAFKKGNYFFDKQLYGQAQLEYNKVIQSNVQMHDPDFKHFRMMSELNHARSAVRLNQNSAESLILDFVQNYSPEPLVADAILEAGDFYYNDEQFEKALVFYNLINVNNVEKDLRSAITFKKGYSLFVRKYFKESLSYFAALVDTPDKYYYPSNYYAGLNHYFLKDYNAAALNLRKVEKSKTYRAHIPYYVSQIYFAEKEYQKTVDYILPVLGKNKIQKKAEMEHLLGKAYFELGQYDLALNYLESYAAQSEKMNKEDFYQIGFVQYKNKNYEKAISNFKELSNLNNVLGQNALFLLGDCYLKTGKKNFARNAFSEASKKEFDLSTKEEASWNYAKLSYELKYDDEAIKTFQKISTASKHHPEAQNLLSNLFLNTNDFSQALSILDALPSKSPQLSETYQKVTYARGVELYNDGKEKEAIALFEKSLNYGNDKKTIALANFRLGDIAYKNKAYNESSSYLNSFISNANGISNLPDDATIYMANYTLGYNALKDKKINQALGHFEKATLGIQQNKGIISNEYVKTQIYIDALQKAGDCAFKLNDYPKALDYYNRVISNEKGETSYALYQKAMVLGLSNLQTEKVNALNKLVNESPESSYVDDAYYQLGLSYQEQGKLELAKIPLQTLVDEHSTSRLRNQAFLRLGLIHFNQEKHLEAASYYKQVISNNPDEIEKEAALESLKEIYVENLGQPETYVEYAESVPGLKMDNTQKESINFETAELAFENADYDQAIASYKKYLSKYPKGVYHLQALFELAESYAIQKDYKMALKTYTILADEGPSKYYVKALTKGALLAYNIERDFAKAYELYKKLEPVAESPELKLQSQIGMLESAYRINNISALTIAANKVESNGLASPEEKALAHYYRAKVAMDNADNNKALNSFNQVLRNIKAGELAAEARYQIAKIYFLQEEYEISKGICFNSHKESAGQKYWISKSAILLAKILEVQNDFVNSKATLEAIIESGNQLAPEIVEEARLQLGELNKKINSSSKIDNSSENEDLEMEKIEENEK